MSFQAIDLFAGAGGFTLSAIQAGVDVLAAIEFDKSAAHTYKKNLIDRMGANIELLNNDINKIDPKSLRERVGINKGELDLILGGPPCQGFSSHRIKGAGINDPRNELLLRYFAFVKEFRPKAFLVENVAGLLWPRHEDYLNQFLMLTQKSGYVVRYCNTLNAKDYGVPQNRNRVFIFAVRDDKNYLDLHFPPKKTHSSSLSNNLPSWRTASVVFDPVPKNLYSNYWDNYFSKKTKLSKEETFSLLESLESLESGRPIDLNDLCNVHMKPSKMMVERFTRIGLNGSRDELGEDGQLKCHSNGYKGHKDVYGRIMIHQPSNTITTGCNNPSKGRFVHPWENHGITLRHCARFQSFPDDFIFYGSSTEQARQIGNAVPPMLGEILISSIADGLQ